MCIDVFTVSGLLQYRYYRAIQVGRFKNLFRNRVATYSLLDGRFRSRNISLSLTSSIVGVSVVNELRLTAGVVLGRPVRIYLVDRYICEGGEVHEAGKDFTTSCSSLPSGKCGVHGILTSFAKMIVGCGGEPYTLSGFLGYRRFSTMVLFRTLFVKFFGDVSGYNIIVYRHSRRVAVREGVRRVVRHSTLPK